MLICEASIIFANFSIVGKLNISFIVISTLNKACTRVAKLTAFRDCPPMVKKLAVTLICSFSKINISADEILKGYYEIVKRVKEHVQIPVSVKLSPYFTDLGNIVSQFDMLGVNGIVMFNRFYSPDIDLENDRISSGPVYSNANDYTDSLRWIAMLKEQVTCDLSASGGVHTPDTMFKMLLAGANSVQVVSAIYKNGHGYIRDLLSGIEKWMDKKQLADIEAVQKFGRELIPHHGEVFERAQFMKYFGQHGEQ